eukprot:CAMPEP_0185744350 /NCGR_PEP_ID=MMETSP1174-20130828/2393_1 /TAXON_ID=35687 /ORGANISM="Dictyocha speculum, Strain CCMP1381" /LENGTH=565 /DNA_ID=CAMNT_0028417665 /DNA_START=174 /DNA_END=1872 /DNA_ORIENTATION=+
MRVEPHEWVGEGTGEKFQSNTNGTPIVHVLEEADFQAASGGWKNFVNQVEAKIKGDGISVAFCYKEPNASAEWVDQGDDVGKYMAKKWNVRVFILSLVCCAGDQDAIEDTLRHFRGFPYTGKCPTILKLISILTAMLATAVDHGFLIILFSANFATRICFHMTRVQSGIVVWNGCRLMPQWIVRAFISAVLRSLFEDGFLPWDVKLSFFVSLVAAASRVYPSECGVTVSGAYTSAVCALGRVELFQSMELIGGFDFSRVYRLQLELLTSAFEKKLRLTDYGMSNDASYHGGRLLELTVDLDLSLRESESQRNLEDPVEILPGAFYTPENGSKGGTECMVRADALALQIKEDPGREKRLTKEETRLWSLRNFKERTRKRRQHQVEMEAEPDRPLTPQDKRLLGSQAFYGLKKRRILDEIKKAGDGGDCPNRISELEMDLKEVERKLSPRSWESKIYKLESQIMEMKGIARDEVAIRKLEITLGVLQKNISDRGAWFFRQNRNCCTFTVSLHLPWKLFSFPTGEGDQPPPCNSLGCFMRVITMPGIKLGFHSFTRTQDFSHLRFVSV